MINVQDLPAHIKVLRIARELVIGGWCRGAFAEAQNLYRCSWDSHGAARFCTVGAVYRAGKMLGETGSSPAFRALEESVGGFFLSDWNDASERTQAEVVAAFDEAIRRETEKCSR